MAIKLKTLKKYIFENSSSTIRSRRDQVQIIDHELSSDKNLLSATVLGSTGQKYTVTLKGLQKDAVEGACTCPYDHGQVCKHQVAVAYAVDEILMLADQISLLSESVIKHPSSFNEQKFSKTAPILVSIPDPLENIKTYLKRYITASLYNTYNRLSYGMEIKVLTEHIDVDNPNLELEYKSALIYKGEDDHLIKISKQDSKLMMHCDCDATNKYLCRHQMAAIEYLHENLTPWFWNEKRIDEEKQKQLKEYGYDIKDSYQEHFSFSIKQNKFVLIPKKQGVLKLSTYQTGIEALVNDIIYEGEAIKHTLPIINESGRNSKMIMGFGIWIDPNNDNAFEVFPFRGNVKKNDILSNSIYKINAKYFYEDLSILTNDEREIAQKIITCFKQVEGAAVDVLFKTIILELKTLLPEVNKYPLYVLEGYLDNSYSYYREKINPKRLTKIDKLDVLEKEALHFRVTEEEVYFLIEPLVTIKGRTYRMCQKNIDIKGAFLVKNKIFYLVDSFAQLRTLVVFKTNDEIRIAKSEFEAYYKRFLEPLSKKYNIDFSFMPKKQIVIGQNLIQKQLYLSEIHGFILLKPIMDYADKQVEILNKAKVQTLRNGVVEILQRDEALETDFIDFLQGLHPEFETQNQNFFYLSPIQFTKDMWFLNAFEKLRENGVKIFGYDNLSIKKYNLNKPTMNINLESGMDWFDVKVEVAFGDIFVSLKDIQKSIVNKSKYIELDDGSLGIIPEKWLEKYAHLFRIATIKNEKLRVSKYQFSIIDTLYDQLDQNSEILERHREIKERLLNFDKIQNIKKPRGLKATLRDYQKEGLNWLNFLNDYNFGGCLADDMGLGKTIQIISFLKHIKNTIKPKQANLIVVPTSLIFNWQEEIQKFCPTLKVLVHTTGNRDRDSKTFKAKDIILTTYGIVMRDIEFLKKYKFHYIVLDESQAIKNPASQRYKAMKLLKANNRLVLTGTPIENNTFDLYAQMSFANPGLLGTMAHFKKHFSTPIDKDKNVEAANELRQLINPFMMRRTKEQVAKDLPEKTEQILYCTMAEDQQKLYDAYRNKYRNYLMGKIEEEGVGKSKMYVLEGLMKLRQICDAPQLLNDEESYAEESVKIKELIRHITKKTGKHKVLVFSQFVKMLSLIKTELNALNIPFEYLDGKTKNRQDRVDNFQNNDEIRVFLISLKAGGTGLNLTAAEYVYLVDPWWNPAVEAQAIDRCYRIGQTKNVMAYKMICTGTIEEKIIKYQERKKQVSNDIIQTDESFVKSLSKETIVDLFS